MLSLLYPVHSESWAHIHKASQSTTADLGSVHTILFIMISKSKLMLDSHSNSEMLCGYGLCETILGLSLWFMASRPAHDREALRVATVT